ncbi:hypothetical protein CK203_066386 [Vitis vinifera]|uniref:BED-type domain-containing protein n=1 Tax=Vitis vinifera TaxID=29760 RepID=A0A438G225_VITVI|nr:hypothetical protein CK203_066386 [Vitis vinifera]
MASKHDIGWEHAEPVGGSRRTTKCKYCGKVIHGGITRLKQHIAHISGQVEGCPRVPVEVSHSVRQHMSNTSKEKAQLKKKKERLLNSLNRDNFYEIDEGDSDDEIEEVAMADFERRQMKQAMKESRRIFEEGGQEHQQDGSSSQPSNARIKRGLTRSFSVREGASIPPKGIDPYMFPSKQKSIKSLFSTEGVKKVGKAISKFFLFNAIPFNAADNGPYYQSMIDTIAEAGPGIKGPTGYQIGNTYLEEEVQELEVYITTLKAKWPIYGCTIMCDGWSSRTRKPIINFMIYCDRSMIYHSSVDTTNIPKTADYIFSLMDKVVEKVGEENVVQVVTDNEASFKAVGMLLMEKRKHLFWSPCVAHCIDLMLEDIGSMKQIKETLDQAKMIIGFIYNSLKVVNFMKVFTKDRDLLRPGITRFATEFISLESLIRYEADLKRMCTTNEWREFNKDRSRKSVRDKVSNLILTERFWKKAGEVQAIMEPLVKVLKLVDQDKKPTLSIIYEAMDRAKLAIKASIKQWEKYWEVIDRRWEGQLHRHLHAAVGLKEVIKRLEPDLDRQAKAINEVKLFVDGQGEFGSALTKKAINQSLPAEWWNNYGDEGPHLQKIAVKILSQTCSSSGCERNWSTWSLIHTKLRNRLAMKKLHKLVYVHYNMRLRVKNLMQERRNEDLYNPIDLNHIFNDDDILDEWIREGEEPILSSDNLDWLDKGLPTNEEGRERDVDSRRKCKASRTISSSLVVMMVTIGAVGGVVALVGAIEELVALVRVLGEMGSTGAVISNHHRIDEHLQNLGIGSRPYFREVDDRSYHNFRDRDSSSSTFSRNDFNQFPMMHPEGYSNTGTRASDSYGYDQSSSSSSIAYRGFGYYQAGVDPEQPSKPYFPDYGSSNQSSHPPYLSYEPLFQSYPHYGNCHPNLYARCRTDDDDDFEPPRHSTWN